MAPCTVFNDARMRICQDPLWQCEPTRAFEGSPSLHDGLVMLERAQAHLGIRGTMYDAGVTDKFYTKALDGGAQ